MLSNVTDPVALRMTPEQDELGVEMAWAQIASDDPVVTWSTDRFVNIAMLVHLTSVAKAAVAAIAAFDGESVGDVAARLRAGVLDMQHTARRRTMRLVDPDDPPGE
jgi:hypothetical protein